MSFSEQKYLKFVLEYYQLSQLLSLLALSRRYLWLFIDAWFSSRRKWIFLLNGSAFI